MPKFCSLFCILCYGCWLFFLHIPVIYSGYFFFTWGPTTTDQYSPADTHAPTLRGFSADAHRFTLKCWSVVGGVGWTTFRDAPYESDFILVTQVRAILCCLLILFLTQSGSCTFRPPRVLLCCFPLHRRQISSDMTSSPLSSTSTKTQTSKGPAWRLNKSACNSAKIVMEEAYYGAYKPMHLQSPKIRKVRSRDRPLSFITRVPGGYTRLKPTRSTACSHSSLVLRRILPDSRVHTKIVS